MQIEARNPMWRGPLSGGSYSIHAVGGALSVYITSGQQTINFWLTDLPQAVCLVRDLEHALDTLQPGLFFPLPPNDPSEIDAIAVHAKADMIERGVK